jgi:hypothetical protein
VRLHLGDPVPVVALSGEPPRASIPPSGRASSVALPAIYSNPALALRYIRGYTGGMEATRKRYSFFIGNEQADALKALKARDGIAESEAIRRALDQFLQDRGVLVRPEDAKPRRRRGHRIDRPRRAGKRSSGSA